MYHHSELCDISIDRATPQGPVIFPKLSGEQPAWFALYVQVNHEKEVAQRLIQKSIDNFLPLSEQWSKRKDRRKKIHTPLFPGYVFVRAILDNYTNVTILKTPGIVSILRNSEGPLPIPDFQIDSLRAMLSIPSNITAHAYLKEGTWVQVVRGPLMGAMGILVRQNPKKGKLVVSVDIIQKAVCVELDMEDVDPVDSPARATHH